jgi:hypothetical protein
MLMKVAMNMTKRRQNPVELGLEQVLPAVM